MRVIDLKNSRGFTLIEMVIAIVVLAAAVSGVLFSFTQNISSSADPMIQQQAIIIAQGYLEEAMLKPYNDPDGGETSSCEEAARIQYDDVADYACINDTSGAIDQFGGSLPGLGAYNVAVAVSTVNIGSPAVAARRISVTVTHDSIPSINLVLTAYRTSYY
ncbi:MAG: prepilin-type N-terminal cleavage/methylation domain-containing protein [Gammaproteobacteria bacterium]|nr:prepilin-type N-terminal cleavage/methylation domain-containing protein [Gammaproteobacteria bacterium]